MKLRVYVQLLLFIGFGIGCASAPISPIADGTSRRLDGYLFELDSSGQVLVEAEGAACASLEKKPKLRLSGEDSVRVEAVATCRSGGSTQFWAFRPEVGAGKYRLDLVDAGSAKGVVKGQVFLNPKEPEKKSGPDQAYLGATPLSEGVHQATLSPSGSDRTDWWSIQMDAFARVSVYFQHNAPVSTVSAQMYRYVDGRLLLKQRLSANQATQLGLEGTYYIKIIGENMAPLTSYSLALKMIDVKKEEGGGGAAVLAVRSPVPLIILETWPIEAKRTAVLLGAGTGQNLKPGDTIKLFSNGTFLDACKVVGIGPNESECHVERAIGSRSGLTAKRALE